MRNRGVLLLALVIAAVLAAGAVYAFVNAGDDSTPLVTQPTPTASATATATPSPTPTATPSATSAPTTSPTAAPTGTSSPRATRTTTTYAYPKPTHGYSGLEVTLTSNPQHGTVGQAYQVTVDATDGDGTIYFDGLTWGDGSSQPAQANPQHCKSYPPLTSPPGPYQPQPDKKTYSFTHRYLKPGTYDITVHIASVNVDCRPNGPRREDRSLTVRVYVAAP